MCGGKVEKGGRTQGERSGNKRFLVIKMQERHYRHLLLPYSLGRSRRLAVTFLERTHQLEPQFSTACYSSVFPLRKPTSDVARVCSWSKLTLVEAVRFLAETFIQCAPNALLVEIYFRENECSIISRRSKLVRCWTLQQAVRRAAPAVTFKGICNRRSIKSLKRRPILSSGGI